MRDHSITRAASVAKLYWDWLVIAATFLVGTFGFGLGFYGPGIWRAAYGDPVMPCAVRPAQSKNVQFSPRQPPLSVRTFGPDCVAGRKPRGGPAWKGTATTIARGMRFIEEGFFDTASVADLADRLGIGPRRLVRLFPHHTGATPREGAATRRLQTAKRR